MKTITVPIAFLILTIILSGCVAVSVQSSKSEMKGAASTEPKGYDESYAKRLGADEYGMKKYVMAFLKRGPKRDHDSVTAVKIQAAHLKNITRMADEGKLVVAGPFLDRGEFAGIYVFNVESVEEAKKLTETDPAVQAGRLVMELHPWYGSAILQELNALHKRVMKQSISD